MSDILQKLRAAAHLRKQADDALYALAESLAGRELDRVTAEEWAMLSDTVVTVWDGVADSPEDIDQAAADELQAEWSAAHVPQ